MPHVKRHTSTIAVEMVLGRAREHIGGVAKDSVRVWVSDDAGDEFVEVRFYRARAIVFSHGIHAVKTLSTPPHECGVLVTHKTGAAVLIKAAGLPRVRIVDDSGTNSKEK
jgi:hypothetical protein